jgi:hypothetical protein
VLAQLPEAIGPAALKDFPFLDKLGRQSDNSARVSIELHFFPVRLELPGQFSLYSFNRVSAGWLAVSKPPRAAKGPLHMKQMSALLLVLVLIFPQYAAFGQTAPAPVAPAVAAPAPTAPAPAAPAVAAPAPAAPAPAAKVTLKEGTDVKLKFSDNLSSKTAAEGDPVNLVLDEDLKVADVVVARAGAKATGTITHAKKAGMMGKAGELNMRLEHLKVGDQRVKLRGSKGKEGEGKEGTAVALTVLFGPIGLIKHGKNVDVKAGTPITAYVDEDTPLEAAK